MFAGKEYPCTVQSEDNTNNKSDDGDGLDKVQPKAVKKKFKDRKDKDIDNDGDVDSSDKYLHKRRKAVSKAIKKEDGFKFDGRSKSFKETLRRLGYVKEKSLVYTDKKTENKMSDYMRNRKSLSSIADAYRAMYAKPNEEILNEELIDSIIEDVREEEIEDIAKYLDENKDLDEGALADKAKKSGISVGTLRKVYNRGMAAWKTGHRPGTTPQQWGMARVNAFISKKKSGKLNHDQDLAHIVHPDDSMLDEAMKLAQIVRKHKSALMKAKRTGNLDLPKKVEDDLSNWASKQW